MSLFAPNENIDNIDTENQSVGFEVWPQGIFKGVIFEASKGINDNAKEFYKFKLKVNDMPGFMFDQLYLSSEVAANIAKARIAAIVKAADAKDLDLTKCPEVLQGLPVVFEVEHNQYKGKTQARVKKYLPLNTECSKVEKKDDTFKASGTASGAPRKQGTNNDLEDEIPFFRCDV